MGLGFCVSVCVCVRERWNRELTCVSVRERKANCETKMGLGLR